MRDVRGVREVRDLLSIYTDYNELQIDTDFSFVPTARVLFLIPDVTHLWPRWGCLELQNSLFVDHYSLFHQPVIC